jgi:ATP-dependent Zn protease
MTNDPNEKAKCTERPHVKRQGTAYHEAGHAVITIVLGLPVTDVTIQFAEEDNANGSMTHPSPLMFDVTTQRERRTIARSQIIACYAGYPAELLTDPDADAALSQGDEENAFDLSRQYAVLPRSHRGYVGDDVHVGYLGRLKAKARRLVQTHQAEIAVVAAALLERTSLSGDEVKQLLQPAPR